MHLTKVAECYQWVFGKCLSRLVASSFSKSSNFFFFFFLRSIFFLCWAHTFDCLLKVHSFPRRHKKLQKLFWHINGSLTEHLFYSVIITFGLMASLRHQKPNNTHHLYSKLSNYQTLLIVVGRIISAINVSCYSVL